MGSRKIDGIYVAMRGDYRQLKADLDAAKTIVKDAAGNMSDAMGGAVSPDKLKKSLNSLVTDLSQLQRSSKPVADSMKNIGFAAKDLGERLGLPEKQFAQLQQRMLQTQAAETQVAALRRIAQQARLTKEEIRDLGKQMGVSDSGIAKAGGGSMLDGLGLGTAGKAGVAAAAVYAVARSAQSAGQAVYDSGAKMERLDKSLTAITGSKAGAAETLNFIRDEAFKAGAVFLDTADNYKTMLASGTASGMAEKDIRNLFAAVVEAGAVVGMTDQQQSRSLQALSQMMSKGTVQSEELRQQLGESLPGAYAIAAKAMGVTTAQLAKMLEQGQVVSKDFLPKFATALRTEFAGSLEDAANSGVAAVGRMESSWEQLKASFYNSGAIISTVDALREAMDKARGKDSDYNPDEQPSETISDMRDRKAAMEERLAAIRHLGDASPKVDALRKQLSALDREILNAQVATGKNVVDQSRLRNNDESTAKQREEAYKFQIEQQEKATEAALKFKGVLAEIAIARAQAAGGGEFDIKRMQEEKNHTLAMLGYQKELLKAKLDATVDSAEIQKSMSLENERHSVLMAHLDAEERRAMAERMASMQTALNKLSDITGYYDTVKELRAKADTEASSQDPVTQANAYIKRDAAVWQAERSRVQTYSKDVLALQQELANNQSAIAGLTATYSPQGSQAAQALSAELQGKQRDLELTRQLADAKRDLAKANKDAQTDDDPALAAEIERLQAYIDLLEQAKQSNQATAAAKVADIKASREASYGMQKSLKDYTATATNSAENSKQLFDRSFSAMEDSATDFAVKGKTSISSLFETLRAEFYRTQLIRPVMGAFSSGLESGALWSGLKGIFSSIFHDGGTVGESAAPMRAVSPALFAGAPRFHNGLASDEYPAILQKGEDVISRRQKAQLRNMSSVSGAPSVSMPVTIINSASESVQATARQVTTAQGGPSLEIMIDKIVAQKLATPGSATGKALRSNFGVSRVLTQRG